MYISSFSNFCVNEYIFIYQVLAFFCVPYRLNFALHPCIHLSSSFRTPVLSPPIIDLQMISLNIIPTSLKGKNSQILTLVNEN